MSNVIEIIQGSTTIELGAPVGPQGATGTTDFNQLQNVPSTFPPSAHVHPSSEVTDFSSAASAAAPVQSVAGRAGAVLLAKSDVGLTNADNTSDLDKPVSTATQTALNGKQASGSYAESSHVHPIATTSAAGFLSSSNHIKLLTIQTGAEVNVNADWTATTGDAVILNKPVLNGVITNAFPSGFGNGVANINWAAASYWSGSLGMTGGTTIAFQNVIVGKTITLDIGNSAGYLLQWPVGITWIGGSPATSALGSVVTSIRVQVLALSTTQFIAFSLVPFTDKPSTATSPGIQGQLAWGYDDGAERLYICVANNIWRRATIATWS